MVRPILSSCASQPIHFPKKSKIKVKFFPRCSSGRDLALPWPGLNSRSGKRFFKARLDGAPGLGVPADGKGVGTRLSLRAFLVDS